MEGLKSGLVLAYQPSGRIIPPGERGPASVAVSETPQARSGSSSVGGCTFAGEVGDVAKDRDAVGESHVVLLRGVHRVLRRRHKDNIIVEIRAQRRCNVAESGVYSGRLGITSQDFVFIVCSCYSCESMGSGSG